MRNWRLPEKYLAAAQPIGDVRELLHLDFHQYRPAPALQPWVQGYWSMATHLRTPRIERLYPDGGSSLVLDFTGSGGSELKFNAFHTLNHATLAGKVDIFGVRLQPGGAFGLLGLPVMELIDQAWSLRELEIPGAREFFERMRDAAPAARPGLMDAWLLRLAEASHGPGLVQKLLPTLVASDDNLDDTLAHTGIGRRKLERLFDMQVGLPPKQLKLLLRVRRARFLIKVMPWLSLGEVALQCGYFDQAHFTRQFHRIVGTTPGEYRERQLARIARGELGRPRGGPF